MYSFAENWDRGRVTLEVFSKSHYFALLGRSGSSFMTILIALERYVVITFPYKAGMWFTHKRVLFSIFSVTIFSVTMGIPRFSSTYVSENKFSKNISAVKDMEYIIVGTKLGEFWYVTVKGFFNQIDYWVPLPVLLVLNGLIYKEVSSHNRHD